MQIILNGDRREIASGSTVAALIDQLELGKRRIAVEVNHAIVRRDRYVEHALREGDSVEVVEFVGGG